MFNRNGGDTVFLCISERRNDSFLTDVDDTGQSRTLDRDVYPKWITSTMHLSTWSLTDRLWDTVPAPFKVIRDVYLCVYKAMRRSEEWFWCVYISARLGETWPTYYLCMWSSCREVVWVCNLDWTRLHVPTINHPSMHRPDDVEMW